jgi:hypothetical protein
MPYTKDAEVQAITVPDGVTSSMSPAREPSMTSIDSTAMPLLWPDESYAFSFAVSKPIGKVVKYAGFAEVKWCSYMGEHGVLRSEDALVLEDSTVSSSASSSFGGSTVDSVVAKAVRIDCVSAPADVTVGVDFTVLLRITNNGSHALSLQLVSREPSSSASSSAFHASDSGGALFDSQLIVTGLASAHIGVLGAGDSYDCPISLCALSTGLQELKNICVVDLATAIEYPSGSLCKIFVSEDRSNTTKKSI